MVSTRPRYIAGAVWRTCALISVRPSLPRRPAGQGECSLRFSRQGSLVQGLRELDDRLNIFCRAGLT